MRKLKILAGLVLVLSSACTQPENQAVFMEAPLMGGDVPENYVFAGMIVEDISCKWAFRNETGATLIIPADPTYCVADFTGNQ